MFDRNGRTVRDRTADTMAAALAETEVLKKGEAIVVLENGERRVGDGVNAFSGLKSSKVRGVSTKTANYTLTASDDVVVFNGTSLTATLPSAVTSGAGKHFTVKNINVSALTVASAGGNIDSAATASLAQWAAGRYVSNGTIWLSV